MKRKKEMGKKKKAMLFTISLVLISFITLSIAVMVSQSYQKSQVRFYEIGSMDRLNDLSSSIEQGIREIFTVSSGISLSLNVSSSTVTFSEELPSPTAESFRDDMDDFQTFVESQFPEVSLNLVTVEDFLPLVVLPYNVTFTHPLAFGQDRINVIPEQINFNSYEIYVYVEDDNVSEIDWGGPQSGSDYMSVTAEDAFGNFLFEERGTIDFNKNVAVEVFLESGQKVLIKIDSNDNGELRIQNEADVSVFVNTTIDFDNLEEPIHIGFPEGSIYVNYSAFGISKTTTVKIA